MGEIYSLSRQQLEHMRELSRWHERAERPWQPKPKPPAAPQGPAVVKPPVPELPPGQAVARFLLDLTADGAAVPAAEVRARRQGGRGGRMLAARVEPKNGPLPG
jgi:hypothetical protein